MRDQTASAGVRASDPSAPASAPSTKRPSWWPILLLAIAGFGFATWLVFVWVGKRTRIRLWFIAAGISAASLSVGYYVAAGTGPDSASSTVAGFLLLANWFGGVVCVLVVRRRSRRSGDVAERARSEGDPPPRRGTFAWKSRKSSSPAVATQAAPKAPPKLWIAVVIAAAALALSAWGLWVFVGNQVEDITLAHQGVTIRADVTGQDHQDSGDGTASDYLWVRIPACGCSVLVPTDNPAAHPVGSKIPVRYNPHAPTQAQALVNVPAAWFGDVTNFAVLAFALISSCVLVQRARRGRSSKQRTVAIAEPPQRVDATGMVVVGSLLSDRPAPGRSRTGSLRGRIRRS